MTHRAIKSSLPSRISDFIRDHFSREILTTVTARKNRSGKTFFYVDISQDNSLFHLKFDETGKLLEKSDEPLQELYDDEEVTDPE